MALMGGGEIKSWQYFFFAAQFIDGPAHQASERAKTDRFCNKKKYWRAIYSFNDEKKALEADL
jgi:hypothetical protein